MTTHTPGPWKIISETCSNSERVFDLQTEDDRPLGRIYGDNAVWLAEGEDEANARLIAAAPDLLAACKAALEHIQTIEPLNGIKIGYRALIEDQLKVAISKTRGALHA